MKEDDDIIIVPTYFLSLEGNHFPVVLLAFNQPLLTFITCMAAQAETWIFESLNRSGEGSQHAVS